MDTTELTYPIFEANQVLTNAHLNDLFEYLDEQQRLTRANLIGIGIACGLEVEWDGSGTIRLSKGVGVTSQGYLITEPDDVDLVAVRSYKRPVEYGYGPFDVPGTDPAEQYDLWELFTDAEPGTQPLAASGLVFDDKAVVLFLELRKDGLRNCSTNNCDDRGAQVTATVRRLLIDVADLGEIVTLAEQVASDLVATDLGVEMAERLALPDLRMARVDVPNTGPVEPEEILAAFQQPFRQGNVVAGTVDAFTKLYQAFRPLVADEFPTNPFTALTNRFGFLDANPVTTVQVRFLQYYWDLFDDLFAAYDELRWKGVDLMCACGPPEELFPRHLMAGVLDPSKYADPAAYRHTFVPSPAVGDCEQRSGQVRALFQRLVTMLASFSEAPALPPPVKAGSDPQIRVTPTRWGDVALSAKAIPYYYEHDTIPPVYELWDPIKTSRGRANQNLGYRADEYSPAPPAFVSDPLRFDLEPNNFLRVEGHLGKPVRTVVETLLTLQKSRRLPFEVIALRTGAFDERIEVDLSQEECRFQDLDTLYEAMKSEVVCFLSKQIRYFYALPHPAVAGEKEVASSLKLIRDMEPEYRVHPGTIGRVVERILTWTSGQPQPHVAVVAGTPDFPTQVYRLVRSMADLADRLDDDVRMLDVAAFGERYRQLVEVAREFDSFRNEGAYDAPGLAERLDDIIFRCRLDPFEALDAEYRRRVREVKQARFLGHFLERHPGIQHKAGVPLGGTFIVVYHELPKARKTPKGERGAAEARLRPVAEIPSIEFDERLVNEALARLAYKRQVAEDPDVALVYQAVTGKVLVPRQAFGQLGRGTYHDAVAELADGTVIADFFLPYECCSGCSPIHFTLPPAQLRVGARMGCTNADGFADVTLVVDGATGSVSVQVDGAPFEELTGPLLLDVGAHTIVVRDDSGAQSAPTGVAIPPQLRIENADVLVDEPNGTYRVSFTVAGGTPPFVAEPGTIVDAAYTSPPIALDETLTVKVGDTAGCTVQGTFESGVEPCAVPCGGVAVRRGYRFWIPEAQPNLPLNGYAAEVAEFVIIDPDGNQVDFTGDVNVIVNRAPSSIRTADFAPVVHRWVDAINRLVAEKFGSDQWFRLDYEPANGSTTGTLWVERIECVDFSFRLLASFAQGRRERQLELAYNSNGTEFVDPRSDSKARIPAFDGWMSNKCRPDEPPVPLCDGVGFELAVVQNGVHPDPVVLTAVAEGGEQPAAYLWEVQDGIPDVAGGEQIVLRFEPVEPIEKLVRLTAFTEKGCSVTVERVVDILVSDG